MRPAVCYRHFGVRPRGINSHDEIGDAGNAVIEFVFVAVLILIPLVYFVVAVASVQRSSVAVTHAAREAGRALPPRTPPIRACSARRLRCDSHWPIKVFPTMRLCATSRRMGLASLG